MLTVDIGKDLTIDVDVAALPANVMDHVVYIGLRNILGDAHAGIRSDEPDYQDKSLAISQKKLDAMMAGELRVSGTRARTGDPVKREAIRLATNVIVDKLGKNKSKYTAASIRAAAISYLERAPELMEVARANVERESAVDIDLSELGLVAKS